MNDAPYFDPRTVTALIVIAVLSFAGASYFALVDKPPQSAGANAYSVSAVGHLAFTRLLARRGIPVIVSRSNSTAKAGDRSLLIHAEPSLQSGQPSRADFTLLVLPKRAVIPDSYRSGWAYSAKPAGTEAIERILQQYIPDASVIRAPSKIHWKPPALQKLGRWNQGNTGNDLLWSRIRSRAAPHLETPQLIVSATIEPIVHASEGILVGALKRDGKTIFVISDPDILSNAGIGQGDNAALLVDLIELMRPAEGTVIFDEVVHGYFRKPNLWAVIFELPFIAVTTIAVASLALLLWAATGRFGAPASSPPRSTTTESDLIENSVGLLHQAGYAREIAGSYPEIVLHDLARQLHAPRSMAPGERATWIDQVGAARQMKTTYRALADEITSATGNKAAGDTATLRAVQKLYDWKQELIDGSGRH